MATQAGPKQQAEGLRKSYISTKPSPKGGYNGVWENPVANAPGCGFFTISRASILVQRSPLVMPGSPFSSWLLRSSCWATFSRQSQLIRWPLTGRESTQNLAHTPRKIEHLRKSSRSSDSREKVLPTSDLFYWIRMPTVLAPFLTPLTQFTERNPSSPVRRNREEESHSSTPTLVIETCPRIWPMCTYSLA